MASIRSLTLTSTTAVASDALLALALALLMTSTDRVSALRNRLCSNCRLSMTCDHESLLRIPCTSMPTGRLVVIISILMEEGAAVVDADDGAIPIDATGNNDVLVVVIPLLDFVLPVPSTSNP